MKEFTVAELKLIKRSIFTEICRMEETHPTDTKTIESLEQLYEDVLAEYKSKQLEKGE